MALPALAMTLVMGVNRFPNAATGDMLTTGAYAAVAVQLLRIVPQMTPLAALDAESIAESAISDFDELERTSQHDVLTGTPNRVLMLEHSVYSVISPDGCASIRPKPPPFGALPANYCHLPVQPPCHSQCLYR